MAIALRPLFGLTCVDEAMPPGSDPDCVGALLEGVALRASVERAPPPVLDNVNAPSPPPPPMKYDPDFRPAFVPGPGGR